MKKIKIMIGALSILMPIISLATTNKCPNKKYIQLVVQESNTYQKYFRPETEAYISGYKIPVIKNLPEDVRYWMYINGDTDDKGHNNSDLFLNIDTNQKNTDIPWLDTPTQTTEILPKGIITICTYTNNNIDEKNWVGLVTHG